MVSFKYSALVVSLSALAAAQSLSDLSSSCRTAIASVQGNGPAANCTNVSGLLSILLTPANSSLIPPITSFLRGFCAADDCSNETIAAVSQNLTAGCASDLTKLGIDGVDAGAVTGAVQTFFGLGKDILCLADNTGTPQFCLTEVLTSIQTFVGSPLSLTTLEERVPQLVGEGTAAESALPSSIACTNCVQAAYILLKNAEPGVANGTDEKAAIVQQCGADFEAATVMPNGITEGTGSGVPAAKGSNAALRLVGAPTAMLLMVSAAFAVLA